MSQFEEEKKKDEKNDYKELSNQSDLSPKASTSIQENEYTFKRLINPKDNKFSCCIVWTQLPLISTLFPFIGHTGICTVEGRIFDFAGSQYIGKDELAFNEPYKYVPLEYTPTWNKGVQKANEKYKNEDHNLFCNNCHSHVACALNNMNYNNRTNYNMISVWWMCLTKGKYVSWSHILKNYLGWIFITIIIIYCLIKK